MQWRIELQFGIDVDRHALGLAASRSSFLGHMMSKRGLCAEGNWRKLRGFDYLAKVIKGVEFKDGIEVESDNQAIA